MPSERPSSWLDRYPAIVLAAALGLILFLRLLAFPVNEHIYGDAVARTELAERWAAAPHVITSFEDGAAQFGPLHLYLVGAALSVIDRDDAARVVSLIFGVMTAVPLFAVTRHYFGSRSALVAALAFAPWGLHIQASTTGGSEALGVFLLWVAFAWFARALYRPHWLPVVIAAAAMNLAAATRYDAWMYIPLLGVLMPWLARDRMAGVRYAALFVALSLIFPVFWMIGNAAAHGDPLYPLTYIDAYHQAWADQASRSLWRDIWLRSQGIGFWPAVALVTLTPGVALLGVAGMVSTWRTRPFARWLTVAAVAPTLYYSFRTTVMADFVPLGRFAIVQVSLLLPFVGPGFAWLVGARGPTFARRAAWATAVLAVSMPLALGLYTWRSERISAVVLEPLSPVATNPRSLMRAADFLRARTEAGRTVAIDADARYRDLTVAFYARLDIHRHLRVRWPDFDERLAQEPPDLLAVFDDGRLAAEPWTRDEGTRMVVFDHAYRLLRREGVLRIFEAE